MYTVSDAVELGTAHELVMGSKITGPDDGGLGPVADAELDE